MKKGIMYTLFTLILSPAVFAQTPTAGPWQFMKDAATLIFLGGRGAEDFLLISRVLLGVVMFALLYGLLALVLKGFEKRVRTILAMALAALSSIFVPQAMLVAVATSYQYLFFGALILAAAGGGVYLMHEFFRGGAKSDVFMRGGISALLGWFLGSLSLSGSVANTASIQLSEQGILAPTVSGELLGFIGVASAGFWIYAIWCFGRFIWPAEHGKRTGVYERASEAVAGVGKVKRAVEHFPHAELEGYMDKLDDAVSALSALQAQIPKKATPKALARLSSAIGSTAASIDRTVKSVTGRFKLNATRFASDVGKSVNFTGFDTAANTVSSAVGTLRAAGAASPVVPTDVTAAISSLSNALQTLSNEMAGVAGQI